MNQRGQKLKDPLNKDLYVIQASPREEVHGPNVVAKYGTQKMFRGLELLDPILSLSILSLILELLDPNAIPGNSNPDFDMI